MAQKEQRQNAVAKESIFRRSEKRFLERTKSKRGFKRGFKRDFDGVLRF